MGTKVLTLALAASLFLVSPLAQEEPLRSPRKEVEITGNAAFERRALFNSAGVEEYESHIFKKRAKIRGDECVEMVENLTRFYKREGYFDVSITKTETEKRFVVVIEEGAPYKVSEAVFSCSGGTEAAKAALEKGREASGIREGTVFRVEDYDRTRVLLERTFGDAGFPFVMVVEKAEVDVGEKRVRVSFSVEEGSEARFGDAVIEGIVHSEEAVLRNFVKFRKGQPYSVSKVEETKDALYRTGLFDVVTLKVKKPGEDGSVPVKVSLKEGRHRKVKFALGYGSDEGTRVQLGYETLRLFDRYVNGGFTFKMSSIETSGEVHLLRPFVVSDISAYLKARKQSIDWSQADFDTTLVSAGLEKKAGKAVINADLNLEKINSMDFEDPPPDVAEEALTPTVAFARLGFLANRTDGLLDPTKGFIVQAAGEMFRVNGGSGFARLSAEFRNYIEAGEDKVLALRIRAATIGTSGGIEEIPYPYRYFTGGQMKLRGYGFATVSPLSRKGGLQGGMGLVEASVELRFPLYREFRGVVFADGGRATEGSNPFEGGEPFKYDCGLGVRYMTPVGPIGMDVAVRLNEAAYSPSKYQLALFIGYSF